jgi:hypothetical protein
MCNDFHLLLKVTPRPKVPLSEAELLKRFGGLYSGVAVAVARKRAADARRIPSVDAGCGLVQLAGFGAVTARPAGDQCAGIAFQSSYRALSGPFCPEWASSGCECY